MRSIAILQEMGVPVWQLTSPHRVNAQVDITLPAHCRMLFIAPQFPKDADIALMDRIVQSMGETLDSIFYLNAEQLQLIQQPQAVEWIWFCGEEQPEHVLTCDKQIHSHSLFSLQENPLFKKQLWQQIKTLKGM